MKKITLFLLIVLPLLAAAQSNDGMSAFNASELRHDIGVLASDSLMGRKPFTSGEKRTLAFLQKRFRETGLKPANGNSYLQEVPMVELTCKADPTMEVKGPDESFTLKGYDDYIIYTDKDQKELSFDNNELVFAGFGIVAPEYGWNDYAGLDVKDKIVLVRVNDPGFYTGDSSLFKGRTMTYYGRWTYKFEEAARQGAKGCLIIHNTEAASYPFSVVQNNWNISRLHLDDRNKNVPYSDIIGWVSENTAMRLLNAAGKDSTLLDAANHRGFKPVPLGVKLSTGLHVSSSYDKTYNVMGKITGSKYPDEYIIYTAHWDHLGIGKPDEKGDSIYNGAYDNASGAAGLLQLAKAFNAMKPGPERTIIILSVTAEEQGLWGSAYYAQNPVYPIKKTLANINMDGLNRFEKTNDIIVVGKGQSSLEDDLSEATRQMHRYISFEVHPEAGSYFRSDHFNFAKRGIPALYISTGVDVAGKGSAYGLKLKDDYVNNHYHRPSDELRADWSFEGGIDDLKLIFLVGKKIAASRQWPTWKAGSEFKALRP
jgi:Zn-dependent M28 family amino/carboxypeptidase